MASPIKIVWGSVTDMTVTNLGSLADGQLWQSGDLDDASPSNDRVRISYKLVFNATPIAGDYLRFWSAVCDEASSNEIRSANIGASEGKITTAGSIAEVLASVRNPSHLHFWQTSHSVNFYGSFTIFNFGPSWQLILGCVGEALSSTGHIIRYRYGTPQI